MTRAPEPAPGNTSFTLSTRDSDIISSLLMSLPQNSLAFTLVSQRPSKQPCHGPNDRRRHRPDKHVHNTRTPCQLPQKENHSNGHTGHRSNDSTFHPPGHGHDADGHQDCQNKPAPPALTTEPRKMPGATLATTLTVSLTFRCIAPFQPWLRPTVACTGSCPCSPSVFRASTT